MEDLSGTVLDDRYRLEELLGEGGMGQVYKGRHDITGRKVAIKILLREYDNNAEVVERFYREAKAATAVGNEHICEVLDMRPPQMGAPYLVMEYLEGETLKDRIRRGGPIPAQEAVAIFSQILEGLAAAHDARIIHRDMKPENVFLLPRLDDFPLVKLLDFGISKFSDGSEDHALTQAGTILGSPYYMSPEQANGETAVGPLSDIYSVGVMLHESLTGAVPFDAPTFSALVIKIVTYPPPHASDINPTVPRELGDVVLRAMARHSTDRFRSSREMGAALVNLALAPYESSRDIPSTLIPASKSRAAQVPVPDAFTQAAQAARAAEAAMYDAADDLPPAGGGLGEPPPTAITASIQEPIEPSVGQVGLPEPDFPPARSAELERATDPQPSYEDFSAQMEGSDVHGAPVMNEPSFAETSGTMPVEQPSASYQTYSPIDGSSGAVQVVSQVTGAPPGGLGASSPSLPTSTDDVRTPMAWPQEPGEGQGKKRKTLVVLGVGALMLVLFVVSGLAVVFIGLPLMEEDAPRPPRPLIPTTPGGGPTLVNDTNPVGDGSPVVVAQTGPNEDGGVVAETGDAAPALADAEPALEEAGPVESDAAVVEAEDGGSGEPGVDASHAETFDGPTVHIVITARPDNARILLNGRPLEGNPAEIDLPADGRSYEVEARARGYRRREVRFNADADREVEVSLSRRPRRQPRPSGGGLINPWGS